LKNRKQEYKLVKWLFGKEIEIPEEWELKKIKELTKVLVGLVINPSTYFDDQGTVPMITGKHVTENGIVLDDVDFITKKSNKLLETTRIWSGDLVTMRVGNPGRTSVVKNEHDGINCASVIITRKSKKIVSQFLAYLSNSELVSKQIMMHQAGGVQQVVNVGSWQEFIIPFPSLLEQQKITSILSNVDELISSYEDTIKSTIKLKKGLMQKLLTKGIEHKKFKKVKWYFGNEIRIPEEWNTCALNEICVKITDGEHLKPKYTKKGVPFLTAKNIQNDGINFVEINFISEEDAIRSRNRCNPEFNDVLIVSRGATIGRTCLIDSHEEFCLLGSVLLIKPGNKLVPKFLLHILKSYMIKTRIIGISNSTAQDAIYLRDIQKISIPVPTLIEQENIASILSKIDAKVSDLISDKILLEKLKKGLIQKLLTGQIRVR
jgi:type I restriction enzyme, S subunit